MYDWTNPSEAIEEIYVPLFFGLLACNATKLQ